VEPRPFPLPPAASIQTATLVRAVGDYRENREGQTVDDNLIFKYLFKRMFTFLIITTRSM
jgi:hypothetical protein